MIYNGNGSNVKYLLNKLKLKVKLDSPQYL